MDPRLVFIVSDLMQDRGLRFHFNHDPQEVMDLYGLSDEERRCLLTMNRNKIAQMMKKQFKDWGFPDDGFPTDEHCQEGGTPHYPAPDPKVYKVHPPTIDVTNGQTSFNIYGQSFSPEVGLSMVKQGGSPFTGFLKDVRGSYRCSELYVQIQDVNSITDGLYDLTVTVNPGGGNDFEIPLGPLTIFIQK